MHALVFFLLVSWLPTIWLIDQKALDAFVKLPDPHYQYRVLHKKWLHGAYTLSHYDVINMTSQKWLDETEVDKPVWSHELTVIYPTRRNNTDNCFLIIMGEQNETPDYFQYLSSNAALIHIPLNTRSLIAILKQVPAQPLTFYKHPLRRKNIRGYDILAYSWWRFLNDSSAGPEWLVQFPMVKATVRAMDTIIDYLMKTYGKEITTFTLTGFSMNGWPTWLTAAVDPRVVAIVPVAMDFLNFTENFLHQFRAYCGWSYGLKPLHDLNITGKLYEPRFTLLASHVDPMAYNERYTNTEKFIFVPVGDEVFQPDNSHYYFEKLEGLKYLNIIPNADHYTSQNQKKIMFEPVTFFQNHISTNGPFPIISWNRTMTNTTGTIYFSTSPAPNAVFFYEADTIGVTRRDFRMKIAAGKSFKDSAVKWTKLVSEKIEPNVYKVQLSMPAKGWRAFFLQAVFPKSSGGQLTLTSGLQIIPDTFPCSNCSGDGCRGRLV